MSREFAALAYDNRVSDTGAWPVGLAAPPLIGTSAFHNVSLRVGRLAAQKPFSLHDRMTWLLEMLATVMSFNASWLRADFAPRYWAKVDALLASGLPLNNLPCPLPVDVGRILDTTPADPGYIFAYNFNGPHTGRLLYHGSDSGWCEDLSASCKVSSSTKLCKNMWGYHALNGQASVQEWVRIADAVRSGWVAYYWKENDGSDVIAPKYTYIKAVPGTDFFLAAGFTPST